MALDSMLGGAAGAGPADDIFWDAHQSTIQLIYWAVAFGIVFLNARIAMGASLAETSLVLNGVLAAFFIGLVAATRTPIFRAPGAAPHPRVGGMRRVVGMVGALMLLLLACALAAYARGRLVALVHAPSALLLPIAGALLLGSMR